MVRCMLDYKNKDSDMVSIIVVAINPEVALSMGRTELVGRGYTSRKYKLVDYITLDTKCDK